MKSDLLRVSEGSENSTEFTPEGHEFAFANDYDVVIARLNSDAESLTGLRDCQFACSAFPIPDRDFGAGMPPVVSWLRESDFQTHNRQERFLLHLLPDQTCFEGHFPGQPILPGIIQLHWAVKLSQSLMDVSDQPREILRLKYHNIAVPPRFVELQLEHGDKHGVQFRVHSRDGVHAQGWLDFTGSV